MTDPIDIATGDNSDRLGARTAECGGNWYGPQAPQHPVRKDHMGTRPEMGSRSALLASESRHQLSRNNPMTDPIDKDAMIKRLERKNELLQRRVDRLAEDNELLMLELQARAKSSIDDARKKSWGGNGRY